jgi:hypothetical protein
VCEMVDNACRGCVQTVNARVYGKTFRSHTKKYTTRNAMLLMATNNVYFFPRFPGKYVLLLADADGDRSSLEYLPRPVFKPTVRARRSTTLLAIIDHKKKKGEDRNEL